MKGYWSTVLKADFLAILQYSNTPVRHVSIVKKVIHIRLIVEIDLGVANDSGDYGKGG